MNKEYIIENQKYKLIKEYKDAFIIEDILKKWTEYFDEYDFIVGDYAYDKLRLKGFCYKENKRYSAINDQKNIQEYIKKDCAYECRYFILEKKR
ncbi:MAG: DUF1027 domain-containing protein [Bacilli bacterium]|nr:DUF1027 domain-containing protein [Bacilli bacterium]